MLAKNALNGHLGTLVRYAKASCYEVSFYIDNGSLAVEATCDGLPVSLDVNATVKEMVTCGNRIYAKAVWRQQEHGWLVRAR